MAISLNCKKCPDYEAKKCDAQANNCMCRKCPRNLGVCLITKYCRETESAIM